MDDFFADKQTSNVKYQIIISISLIGLLILTCLVYWPGLSGVFSLDDVNSLTPLNKLGGITSSTAVAQFLSDGVGVLGRPVSMLSFLIDDQYFPGDPSQYRYTNLMLHLICGLAIFIFIKVLLDTYQGDKRPNNLVALTVAALWLLHPFNVSTTLYIVQRMTQLMTLFVIAGLTTYTYGRRMLSINPKAGGLLISVGLFLFTALAALSKENGALIFFYVLALEYTVYQKVQRPTWFRYWIIVFCVIPIILICLYLIYMTGNFRASYALRDFTLVERLFTELRILHTYFYNIVVPPSGNTGLFHDDIEISTSLISPWSTLLSLLALIATLILALRVRNSQPILSFSILWFLSGHLLESTVLPLELYFEHRNYLPMVGPLFGLVYYLFMLVPRMKSNAQKYFIYAIPVLLILASSVFTLQSAKIWGTSDLRYAVWYKEHPRSLRAATMYALSFEKRGQYDKAIDILKSTYNEHPETVSLLLYILKLSCASQTQPPITLSDIKEASANAIYRGILPMVAKQLVETARNSRCPYVSEVELIPVLAGLENTKRLVGPARINFITLLSELYVNNGNLTPAIEALDRAFKLQQLPAIALRQADLLLSAGLYQDALGYVDKARRANANRKLLQPSESLVIDKMEQIIKQKMIATGNIKQ